MTNTLQQTISNSLRKLRQERNLSQAELAEVLSVSQPTLSLVERGKGSLTAEQFLLLLQRYNLAVDDFFPEKKGGYGEFELQNALVRFGAKHLRESTNVQPSQHYRTVHDVVLEVLTRPLSTRFLSALAPVVLRNIDHFYFHTQTIFIYLQRSLKEKRLLWFLDVLCSALKQRLHDQLTNDRKKVYRRALRLLENQLFGYSSVVDEHSASPREDIILPEFASKQSLERLRSERSDIAKKWNILTNLATKDFYQALIEADENDR